MERRSWSEKKGNMRVMTESDNDSTVCRIALSRWKIGSSAY